MHSIAGPLGQPLDAVLATDNLELRALVIEISRHPPTPGVVRELVVTLDRRVRIHLAVCEHLLFPILETSGRADVIDRASADHQGLRTQLHGIVDAGESAAPAFEGFEVRLADHIAFEEELLVPAIHEAAGHDAEGLGHRFSTLAACGLSTSKTQV